MGYIERKCVVVHSQRSGSSRTDSVSSAFPALPLSRHVGSQTLHALGFAGAHIPKSRHSAPESNGVHSRQSSGVPWAPPAGPVDNTALCPPPVTRAGDVPSTPKRGQDPLTPERHPFASAGRLCRRQPRGPPVNRPARWTSRLRQSGGDFGPKLRSPGALPFIYAALTVCRCRVRYYGHC